MDEDNSVYTIRGLILYQSESSDKVWGWGDTGDQTFLFYGRRSAKGRFRCAKISSREARERLWKKIGEGYEDILHRRHLVPDIVGRIDEGLIMDLFLR